ncbi:hypothetical protein OBV_16020 [Oscillibacter valericigenes Sjm18-20]|nr:hypothetical protein OBV_16020 [Oscillibacter valericigenes Sjm18-20]
MTFFINTDIIYCRKRLSMSLWYPPVQPPLSGLFGMVPRGGVSGCGQEKLK